MRAIWGWAEFVDISYSVASEAFLWQRTTVSLITCKFIRPKGCRWVVGYHYCLSMDAAQFMTSLFSVIGSRMGRMCC